VTDDKQEPPLYLDLNPNEALERFIGTKPKEVASSIKKSKKRKGAGAGKPPPARPAKPLPPASQAKKGKRR
jgi:hypothetical protein